MKKLRSNNVGISKPKWIIPNIKEVRIMALLSEIEFLFKYSIAIPLKIISSKNGTKNTTLMNLNTLNGAFMLGGSNITNK